MVELSGCTEVASTLRKYTSNYERNVATAKGRLQESIKEPTNFVMAKAYAEELLEYRKIIPVIEDLLFAFEDSNVCKEELKPIRMSLREMWERL
jgi:hypothetical protein